LTAHLLPVGIFVHLFRETLEADPFYTDLWLEGEICDISRSAAGHTYFSLRDEDGALKCVLFRGQALRQHQLPRVGDQAAVHGGLSIYPRSGSIQLVVDLIRPAGLGAASLELAYLRQQLEAEGLFDVTRKRSLPAWPKVIGVVTSAHGAAWHDVQTVVRRRYPLAMLVLSPARVQGLGAPESIAAALEAAQLDARIEVIILARGGGDSDDLSAFNDEQVARAVFASRIPVVAGIGHATDRTLAEDIADAAAPTPSAAAEICVPSVIDLHDRVATLRSRLSWAILTSREEASVDLADARRRLLAQHPVASARRHERAVEQAATGLSRAMRARLAERRDATRVAAQLLAALDPTAVLQRGYAVLQAEENGDPIFSIAQLRPGQRVVAHLGDGASTSIVERVNERGGVA
jgi:exodeoxyribonuclease VII large subunit